MRLSGIFMLSARSAGAVGSPLSLDLCAPAFRQGRVNGARAGVAHRLRCAAPGGGVCPLPRWRSPAGPGGRAGGCGPDDLRPSGTRILGLWPLDPSRRRGCRSWWGRAQGRPGVAFWLARRLDAGPLPRRFRSAMLCNCASCLPARRLRCRRGEAACLDKVEAREKVYRAR
jgi:hypothetical protein